MTTLDSHSIQVQVIIVMLIGLLLMFCGCSYAYTLDQWADSIKTQEGQAWPYGIKQYGHISQFKARIICQRTVLHAWHDFNGNRHDLRAFVGFLADRYCPIKCDYIGNRNWKRNVYKLLTRKTK